MSDLPQDQTSLLKSYPRPVVHLRREYQAARLCLVFGAGISKGFGLPTWKELVDKIAAHRAIKGVIPENLTEPIAAKVEIFQRHFSNECQKSMGTTPNLMEIKGKWFEILRTLIYEKLLDETDLDLRHPYIGEYMEIIINSPVTITYNFDSCIEMCLDARAKRTKPKERQYETIFPDMLPTRTKGSIYHINGYLPKNLSDVYSEDLVFTEQQFADQFLETTAGRFATLAHYFATRTCLFIGVSLSDENIRYLLRRSALNNPGHYHYYVRYQPAENQDTLEIRKILSDFYFETYNLITLFLDDKGIKALGTIIPLSFEQLSKLANGKTPLKWLYYVTGVPGAGKTSVRRAMRGLVVYSEWMTQALPLMSLPHDSLNDEEREEVDGWTADQFKRKNEELSKECEGIFIIDRAPLDPLSFTEEKDMQEKTKRYWEEIAPSYGARAYGISLEQGSIILLTGDVEKISLRRARKTGSTADTPKYLGKMQDILLRIYDHENTYIIDTRDIDLTEVIKRVSRIIHRGEYRIAVLERPTSAKGDS